MKKKRIKKELKRLARKLSAMKLLVDLDDRAIDQLLEASDRFSMRLNKLEGIKGAAVEQAVIDELMKPADPEPGWSCCDDDGYLYPVEPEPDGNEHGE